MSRLGAIAAMTEERVIGVGGELPWHYAEDLKRFKLRTLGSTVVMGRKTWESLGSKPLLNRRNIVITTTSLQDVEHFRTIRAALDQCQDEVVWFIGGAGIYREAMFYCDVLDITIVPDRIDDPAAVFFPKIDTTIWLAEPLKPMPGDPRLQKRIYHRREPETKQRYYVRRD